MKIHYQLLLIAIIATLMSFSANAQTNDSLILAGFYNNMHGENWKNNTNWLTNTLDTWYGVTIPFPGSSSVVELNLNNNNLVGTLDTSLGDLSSLGTLVLSSNNITGKIPPQLGKLSSLSYLDLSNNNLTGAVPAELAQPNFQFLYLSHNNLSGTIPIEWTYFTNMNLSSVDLSSNNFSGDILPIYNERTTDLNFADNHFSGGESSLLDFFSMLAVGNYANIAGNNFNFDIEALVDKVNRLEDSHGFLLVYAPQHEIPIQYNQGKLSVAAGGTLSNNTYNWYKDGVLDTIIEGNDTYMPNKIGVYYAMVENTIATELKLRSESIAVQTLPVSNVLNFRCSQSFSAVLLQWQTLEDESTIGFNIQRSTDAINYTTIGKLEANDGSGTLTDYKYSDATASSINAGKLFYRLEIIDRNQQKQLSNVLSIATPKENEICTIYPNPAGNYINLKFNRPLQKSITMKVFDLNGRKVKEKNLSGEVNQRVLITELNRGLYNIVLYVDGQVIDKIPLLIR